MDPKMDSGFLGPGESVEHNYNVLRELLPQEVVGIMDQMLCFEVCFDRNPNTGSKRTILILIIGIVDDMAHGTSSLTITIHISIYRPTSLARSQDVRASKLRAKQDIRTRK